MQQFQWPKGTPAELKVYPKNHPQRIPTEKYFENCVRKDINQVRNGQYNNLWLLIASLKNLSDPSVSAGFNTWYWAIEGVLGTTSCKEIGERVCIEEGFTISEGEQLMEVYRLREAECYGLPNTATWSEIKAERDRSLIGYD